MKKFYLALVGLAGITIVSGGQIQSNGGPTMVETPSFIGEVGTPAVFPGVQTTLSFSTGTSTGSTSTTGGDIHSNSASGGTTGVVSTNGSTSGTTGTTSGTTGTTSGTWMFFVANQGSGYNTNWNIGGDSNSNQHVFSRSVPIGPAPQGGTATYVSALGYNVNSGDQISMNDTVAGTNDVVTTLQEYEVPQGFQSYLHYFWRTDYKLVKIPFTQVSIDSRKAFGQPNLTGEYPADPNAPARNVCFNPWIYNGGLFVGNMPNLTGDLSGTARIQYALSGTFPTLVGQFDLAELSIPYAGMPSGATNALQVGLYPVSSTDPNINQNQGTVTWSTGWTLPSNSLSAYNIAAGASPAMINMTAAPTNQNLILACFNESGFVNSSGQGWAYFANSSYGAGLPTAWTNCQPTMWILDPVNTTSYWKYTDSNP